MAKDRGYLPWGWGREELPSLLGGQGGTSRMTGWCIRSSGPQKQALCLHPSASIHLFIPIAINVPTHTHPPAHSFISALIYLLPSSLTALTSLVCPLSLIHSSILLFILLNFSFFPHLLDPVLIVFIYLSFHLLPPSFVFQPFTYLFLCVVTYSNLLH